MYVARAVKDPRKYDDRWVFGNETAAEWPWHRSCAVQFWKPDALRALMRHVKKPACGELDHARRQRKSDIHLASVGSFPLRENP